MNTVDLLIALRERLITAIEQNEKERLNLLYATFTTLKEVSYSHADKAFTVALEDLEYSAQHGVMGMRSKAVAAIPSIETIQAACLVD